MLACQWIHWLNFIWSLNSERHGCAPKAVIFPKGDCPKPESQSILCEPARPTSEDKQVPPPEMQIMCLGRILKFLSVVTLVACSVAQSCPTLCDPMGCSLTGSSAHGIFQARILGWVAISFSRGSFWPRDRTRVSYTGRRTVHHWDSWEANSGSRNK